MNALNVPGFKARFALLIFLMAAASASAAEPVSGGQSRERAAAALVEDLKTDPSNAELWLHLGFAYRKLDKLDQAQQAFEKACALNPRETDGFYMLGLIYESKHEEAAALKAWKDYLAVESNPEKRVIAEKHIHHLSQ